MSNASLLSFLSCFIGGINLLLLVGIYLRGFKMGIFDQGNGMVTCDLQEEEELAGEKYIESVGQSLDSIPNYPTDVPAGYVTDGTSWTSPANQPPPGNSQQPKPASVGLMTTDMIHSNEWKNPHPTYWGAPSHTLSSPKIETQTAGAVQMPYIPKLTLSPEQIIGLHKNPVKLEVSPGEAIDPNNPDGQYLKAGISAPGQNKEPIPSSHRVQTQLDILMPEGEMLSELLNLSEWIMTPCLNTGEQSAEAEKWECINNVYCALSWGRDREKAEIIRRYFRRLDTTYTRKDGTYYSVVTEGNLAKKVINDLIEAYPWDNLSVLDGYRKNNPKEPVKPKVKAEPKQKPNSLAEAVDELLEAVKKVKDAVR